MSEKIRLGFIGAGFMGQIAHMRNYARLKDECELVALAELRPELARKVADRYGIRKVYRHHHELLADGDVDAVVAIMGYRLHHTVVPDVLAAGKHLLTEKPAGCRASSVRAWKAIAEDKRVVYMVGYMKRWDLGTRYAADLVRGWRASGEYGKLTYLRCTMSGTDWTWNAEGSIGTAERPGDFAELPAEPCPEQFGPVEAAYYDMNINFYVHQVNLIRFLLGEDYRLEYTHPDSRVLVATSESGAGVTLEMGLSAIPQTWDEVYRISFEKADVELGIPAPLRDQQNGDVTVRRTTGRGYDVTRPNLPVPSWSFFEQAKGFLQAVRDGRPPFDSAGEAARDLEFIEQQTASMCAAGGRMK